MTQYIIQRSELCMSDPAPFNQHWEARVSMPISEMVDIGAALQPAASALRAGDQVNLTAFQDRNWGVMIEVAQVRVVSAVGKVKVVMVGEVTKVPRDLIEEVPVEQVKLHVERSGKSFVVLDEAGNHLESFVTQEQADAFVASEGKSGRMPQRQAKSTKSKAA